MAKQTHALKTFLSMILKCTWASAFTFVAIRDKSAHFCHYSYVSGALLE